MTTNDLQQAIGEKITTCQRPDGSVFQGLSLVGATAVAREQGCSLLSVEQAALAADILRLRFARNSNQLSSADQLELTRSSVTVVGLGGLGGAVTEMLARAGVGRLFLVDGDRFDETNLNRQLLATTATLGRRKTDVAGERVALLNPACECRLYNGYLRRDNGGELLAGANLAVDCLDTIDARFDLEHCCTELAIPMVTGAVGGTSGQLMSILPGGRGLGTVYATPAPGQPASRGIEAHLGTMGYAAIFIAAMQCAETVNLLLGRPRTLEASLVLTDVAEHRFERIELGH